MCFCREGFSAAIKDDSSLWTWGQNYAGQLGIGGSKVNNVNKISGIDCFHSIVECGESYLLTQYLYSNNDVTYDPYSHHCTMACGANNRGQLGKGDLVNSSVLSKVQDIEGYEVKDLSAGREHALALYSNGDVYSWGSNTIGQLGLGDKVDRMLPVKIQGISDIKYIEAAYAHSMVITNSGNLYAWGEGRDGQLGIGIKETKRLPVLVQGIKNVSSVTGGSAFSIALDEKGRLWSFGSNAYGQLGVISSVPEKIDHDTLFSNTLVFDVNEGDYCSIPYDVLNVSDFSGLEFSLKFDPLDFEIVDVCEFTLDKEVGTGNINNANVYITKINDGYMAFKSTIVSTVKWSGNINTVKIKAKRNGKLSVVCRVKNN